MLKRLDSQTNAHESFSDIALLMLATFVFLLVTILITARMEESTELPRLKQALEAMTAELAESEKDNQQLNNELDGMASGGDEAHMEQILKAVGLDSASGRKDFDLFIEGIRNLPGDDIHLVIDATGSMHGAASFLVPVLRVITARSGKPASAVTWFSDNRAQTYTGTMGDMLDAFMDGAPFQGIHETIGSAFYHVRDNSHAPGAYVLLGDEPSDDKIDYGMIRSPVFPIAIGKPDQRTFWAYETLAKKTKGRMLIMKFQ